MVSDIHLAELVRDALGRLYDPHALAAAPLASELMRRGLLQSPASLFDLLVATIARMKPPGSAPPRSHGWCSYHYLYRRYVDCCSHSAIARELGLSVRQAARIHQAALSAAADILLGGARPGSAPGSEVSATASDPKKVSRRALPKALGPDVSLTAELSLLRDQATEEPLAIAEVVASVFETLGRMAEARGVQLRADVDDLLPSVRLSRVVLRQMLLNAALYLMGVSIGASRSPGAPTLTASARVSPEGETVIIALERTGDPLRKGTAPEKTLDALLAAVTHLARQQQCEVVEETASSDRATLSLILPTSKSTETILALDDNPDVGELLQRLLAGCPYRLVHVRTASRALAIAREVQPAIILLDVVLPVQDGWEVLATLRADPRTARIPIVVCSVLPDRELALSLGAADFLAKPITRASLVQALSRVRSQAKDHEVVSRHC